MGIPAIARAATHRGSRNPNPSSPRNINAQLNQQQKADAGQSANYVKQHAQLANEARGRANTAYNTAYTGYNNILNRDRNANPSTPFYNEAARTGFVTPENAARIRGNGVFDEFAKTGGISPEQHALMLSRGTSAIPGFFDSLRAELGRQNDVSGGSNPGYTSQMSQLARDRSRGAASAATDAELGIQGAVNQGRQWGAGSLSDAEQALVNATQRGRMFGTEGLNQNNYRDLGVDLEALGGVRGLRTDTPGEVSMYERMLLDEMQNQRGNANEQTRMAMNYNPNRSLAERIAPWVNMGTSIASTVAGAGGQHVNVPTGAQAGNAPSYTGGSRFGVAPPVMPSAGDGMFGAPPAPRATSYTGGTFGVSPPNMPAPGSTMFPPVRPRRPVFAGGY